MLFLIYLCFSQCTSLDSESSAQYLESLTTLFSTYSVSFWLIAAQCYMPNYCSLVLTPAMLQLTQRVVESELQQSKRETTASEASTAAVKQQLEQQKKRCEQLQHNYDALKELTTEQDAQLNELDVLVEKLAEKNRDL